MTLLFGVRALIAVCFCFKFNFRTVNEYTNNNLITTKSFGVENYLRFSSVQSVVFNLSTHKSNCYAYMNQQHQAAIVHFHLNFQSKLLDLLLINCSLANLMPLTAALKRRHQIYTNIHSRLKGKK